MNSCCVIEINKFCEIFFTEAFIGCDISAGEEKIHKIWINSFIFFVRGNFIRFRWSLITWLVLRFRASFFLYPNIYSNWMKLFEHICKFIPQKNIHYHIKIQLSNEIWARVRSPAGFLLTHSRFPRKKQIAARDEITHSNE